MFNFLRKNPEFSNERRYIPIGRRLLVVDKRKMNAYTYDKNKNSTAIVTCRRGAVPDRVSQGEEVTVPIFEIAHHPQIRYGEKGSLRKRGKFSKIVIRKLEDREIFNAICCAVKRNQTVTAESLSLASLNYAYSTITSHNLKVDKIIMHPRQVEELRMIDHSIFYYGWKKRWFGRKGCIGRLWDTKIYSSYQVTEGSVYLLAEPEDVGVISIKQDIKKIKANNPKHLSKGRIYFESIGICVMNDFAVSMVKIEQTE